MKIGVTIFLQWDEQRYRCRLVEKRNGWLFIDLPINMKTNRTSRFENGTSFQASFIAEDNTLYAFETTLIGRQRGRVPMFQLTCPDESEFYRLQRRHFVRVDVSVDAAVHSKEEKFLSFTTTTSDLSGGGTALYVPANQGLKDGMDIQCWLVLPGQERTINYLCLDARIVRIFESEDQYLDKASLQFLEVEESQRQQIIRFCFEQELVLKRKGLNASSQG